MEVKCYPCVFGMQGTEKETKGLINILNCASTIATSKTCGGPLPPQGGAGVDQPQQIAWQL